MTTDTGLPDPSEAEGATAAAIDPTAATDTTVAADTTTTATLTTASPMTATAQTPPAVPAFGEALAALDPAAAEAEAQQRAQAAARRTRRRRNALRWSGAVVLALAIGGGTAFALTVPQRTDLPGLGTAPDGRYSFPTLTLPTLPAGQPAPSASENTQAGQHLTDIRKLLLPRPDGASAEGVKSAADGWLADAAVLFTDRSTARNFAEYGLRHTATESWKTGDGATTTIYLLQFADSKAAAGAARTEAGINVTDEDQPALSTSLTGVPTNTTAHDIAVLTGGTSGDYSTVNAGGTLTRYGTFESGDVVAIIVQSGPASLPFTPFRQVLTLQAQMLQ
jgi:hypothetical protein